MDKGYLLLEDGERFEGILIGDDDLSTGEVVFNTSMTGYQEILTDPSYAGQIMTFCYPLIGNYGVNHLDDESQNVHVSGVIISDLCSKPNHYASFQTFADYLKNEGVPCLAGVDTRELVKKIRNNGTMKGVITKNPASFSSFNDLSLFDTSLVPQVSTNVVKTYEGNGPHVALIDYGYKKSILNALLEEGCKVTVMPYCTTYLQICQYNPDGVLLSNGPGDPTALSKWLPEIKSITKKYPTLGICLGHQLIALAYGANTDQLPFGHRGGNHPIKEIETGKVWITSQNHGYVVTEQSINDDEFMITYKNVNDQSIEGLKHRKYPIESVQFHPEAHPGPIDTYPIFKQFLQNINQTGEMTYAYAKEYS
ncbi:carbamoyl phosphate synthase small subunit [Pontibacillus marinus]|uniref:Carbamoyl phosphate synthase small chain n=1 Tax=Pontibacillus marinus BH030004 = DSM 16465 TaxID=1385511 RepID=A0A0A5GJS7_9BACI|nr:carbamoyl phosphate synthase small subunit [Pontibacillus marinus]KGX91463.1 carbamoyl phosphate synthase small subunit [Pontibacillus marinus BH030004 = DSM 16465]